MQDDLSFRRSDELASRDVLISNKAKADVVNSIRFSFGQVIMVE